MKPTKREANKTAEKSGLVPNTMVLTDLITISQRRPFKMWVLVSKAANRIFCLETMIIARVANKSNKTSRTQQSLLHITKPNVPNAQIELN